MPDDKDCGLINTILQWLLGMGTTLFSACVAFYLHRREVRLARMDKKKEEESYHARHEHTRTYSNGADCNKKDKQNHERSGKTRE